MANRPDKYDELKLKFKKSRTRRKFTGGFIVNPRPLPSGPSPDPPPASVPIGKNSHTFYLTGSGLAQRWSGTDEGIVGYVAGCPPPWPPQGFFQFGSGVSVFARKHYTCVPAQGGSSYSAYMVSVGFFKFDTSSLADDVVISHATLRIWPELSLSVGNDRKLTFDWYDWTEPRGIEADWTYVEGVNAHPGIPLDIMPHYLKDRRTGWRLGFDPGSLEAPWLDIPLKDANTNISKTGPTKIRMHISGGAPTYANDQWADYAVGTKGEDPRFGYGDYRSNSEESISQLQYVPQLIVYYD